MIQINLSPHRIDKDLLIEGFALVGLAVCRGIILDPDLEPEDLEPDADEQEPADGGPST